MPPKSKRSISKKGNTNALGNQKCRSVLGFADDSPITSPQLSDQKRRRTLIPTGEATCSTELVFPLPAEIAPKTSAGPGRKKVDFEHLHIRSRFRRLDQLQFPEWVVKYKKWWGYEILIPNLQEGYICFEFNLHDLTALVLYDNQPLPSMYQPNLITSEEKLLDSLIFYRNSSPCLGLTCSLSYLSEHSFHATSEVIKQRKNNVEVTCGLVRKLTSDRVEFMGIFCRGFVQIRSSRASCEHCRQLQKSIRDKTLVKLEIPPGEEHQYAMRLSNLNPVQLGQCSNF